MAEILYFDNAATSWPKPYRVIRSVTEAMDSCGGNPGRGSHRLSQASEELLVRTRETAAELFGAQPENVVFTLNATHALNLAIKGLAEPGDHILIDSCAHNAVFRPVHALGKEKGCFYDLYRTSGGVEEILADISRKRRKNTRIVVATHQSNVCSRILPIREIGEWCSREGIRLIVDASQSAGHLPIHLREMNIDALCMPGHKGLMGPMGIGMLITSPDLPLKTLMQGGAGIASLEPEMPDFLPERLEAGTMPIPAAAGLLAGMEWVKETGLPAIMRQIESLSRCFTKEAAEIPGLTLCGETNGSVVSFVMEDRSPAEIGSYLAGRGICVRTGYHCAPLAHRTLGTAENGTVRVSFSPLNRESQVRELMNALREWKR